MPNLFTPNEDGYNDRLNPTKYKGIKEARIDIYNRWGQKIFSNNNLLEGWNGFVRSTKSSAGVFFWTASYTTVNNASFEKNGLVTLVP